MEVKAQSKLQKSNALPFKLKNVTAAASNMYYQEKNIDLAFILRGFTKKNNLPKNSLHILP